MNAELAPLVLAVAIAALGVWMLRRRRHDAGAPIFGFSLLFVAALLLLVAGLGLGSLPGPR